MQRKGEAVRHPGGVDRAEFNGFAAYITSHSTYKVGVYSSPHDWTTIFGTGTESNIPNTYEWTYEPETANLSPGAAGWCLHTVTRAPSSSAGRRRRASTP